ncbi:MAG TPA: superoxide dismutase family protein, partial [Longimicrobiales bacterium]|nr:superoxide dismutase family protein [Longimicrobiales bacterium]
VGEFMPSADGSVRDTTTISEATLDGHAAIVGRSVVVHASGNEPGPPPGSQSGARVACGVIGISELSEN